MREEQLPKDRFPHRDCCPCNNRRLAKMAVWSSAPPTLMHVQFTGNLFKYRLLSAYSGVGLRLCISNKMPSDASAAAA